MKNGYTTRELTGAFHRNKFTIPEGTRVVYGEKDCDGELFPHWVLPVHVAAELSGSEHDAEHRFVKIEEDAVQPMITRKEYMDAGNGTLHHEYYIQFATKASRDLVLRTIGAEAIMASNDPHFNDIPLKRWDAMHDTLRGTINQRLKGQAENFEIRRFGWSMSDAVCVAKAIAQEYKEANQ